LSVCDFNHRLQKHLYKLKINKMYDSSKVKIVIDPGHGGEATGAIGPTGLQEKDINLSVARYLKRFLDEEGFFVILTRDGDYDVPLEERVRISVENKADIFISIHHNASAVLNRNINRTELYCPFEPFSPSFDLAYKLQKNFKRRFGLVVESPLPANYRVLKGNVPVSVLTEASYISNPEEEELLKREERLILEAEIIFESILEFITSGLPRIYTKKVAEDKVKLKFSEEIEPVSLVVFLDGKPMDFVADEGKEIVLPVPEKLRGGLHRISIYGRCKKGNAFPPQHIEFTKEFTIESFSHVLKNYGPYNLLRIKFFDRYMNPVPPNLPFYVQPKDCEVIDSIPHTDLNGEVFLLLKMEREHSEIEFEINKFSGAIHIDRYPVKRKVVYGKVLDQITGKPLTEVKIEGGEEIVWSEKFGLFESSGEELTFSKRGFYPKTLKLTAGEFTEVTLEPLFKGVLHDKKIFIDPARGGKDKGDLAPKNPTSLINLKIALLLKTLFSYAGASVYLTRFDEETTLDEVERVKRIEEIQPDFAFQIDTTKLYPGHGYFIYYYYRDKESERLARLVKKHTPSMAFLKPEILEYGSYFIIHPKATRLLINPSQIVVLKDYNQDELIKVVAISIFGGLLEYLGFEGFRLKKYKVCKKIDDLFIKSEDLPISIFTGDEVLVPFSRFGSKVVIKKGNKEKKVSLKEGSCIRWPDGS